MSAQSAAPGSGKTQGGKIIEGGDRNHAVAVEPAQVVGAALTAKQLQRAVRAEISAGRNEYCVAAEYGVGIECVRRLVLLDVSELSARRVDP